MEALLTEVCRRAEVKPVCQAQKDVECMVRENGRKRFLFAINHSSEERCYTVPEGYQLLRGEQAGKLRAYEAQILER